MNFGIFQPVTSFLTNSLIDVAQFYCFKTFLSLSYFTSSEKISSSDYSVSL